MTVNTAAAEACTTVAPAADRLIEVEARAVHTIPGFATLPLAGLAGTLRRKHFGNTAKDNHLFNLKSGLRLEDCTYCSHQTGSKAGILKGTRIKADEAASQAGYDNASGAWRICMLASGKGSTDRDEDHVARMVEQFEEKHPQFDVCACLGMLKDEQAASLKDAGADSDNDNQNTSESLYPEIYTSLNYRDHVDTMQQGQCAGRSSCSRVIVGTPMEVTCLRILALVGLTCPDKRRRIGGEREMHLRSLQSTTYDAPANCYSSGCRSASFAGAGTQQGSNA
ncbi:hypothetical protein [Glutamicibacter sp.]|uniref:hypothetical protein n=1 Tax=Glutamicibacter sp. TaxID=1931995 RepID=UPI002FE36B55